MKILIVDDESLIRKSLRRGLMKNQHQVLEAEDGKEGLRLWRTENPDLVVLDILMPGLSGPEVIKAIGPEKTCPTVLISAFSGQYNIETAKQMGADLFIAKPFADVFSVVNQLEELLNEHRKS